jgi:hypothetical protein
VADKASDWQWDWRWHQLTIFFSAGVSSARISDGLKGTRNKEMHIMVAKLTTDSKAYPIQCSTEIGN